MNAIAALITAVFLAIIVLLVLWLARRRRFGRVPNLSHLQCPKCHGEFDYAWIPFVTLSAVKLWDHRYFACPICGQWSSFNIWETIVDPSTHRCPIQTGPL